MRIIWFLIAAAIILVGCSDSHENYNPKEQFKTGYAYLLDELTDFEEGIDWHDIEEIDGKGYSLKEVYDVDEVSINENYNPGTHTYNKETKEYVTKNAGEIKCGDGEPVVIWYMSKDFATDDNVDSSGYFLHGIAFKGEFVGEIDASDEGGLFGSVTARCENGKLSDIKETQVD